MTIFTGAKAKVKMALLDCQAAIKEAAASSEICLSHVKATIGSKQT